MADDDDDRFGMPQSAFEAARDSHGRDSPVYRVGMYVPTRGEVASLPVEDLRVILIDWMWECPSELIPNNDQISAVRSILAKRSDASDPRVVQLISECDSYLEI
ncbi:hypothetical protein [Dyella sp. EPa41]|uniref:hypothetical protein n=1 Tax=Dyella sp. EPa41 TaxID=1561194 RepID=UPI001F1C6304|nr:hypothetical protein [Dyella sp. EPa41]